MIDDKIDTAAKLSVLLGLMSLVACFATSEEAADFPIIEELLEAGYFGEENVETAVAEYGEEAVPYLLTAFASARDDPKRRGDIAFMLGKFGVSESCPEIIEFINAELNKEMTKARRTGITMALFGLGFLGTEESLAFLVKVAQSSSWTDSQNEPTGEGKFQLSDARNKERVQSAAILGLGSAGSERATQLLDGLAQEVPEDLRDNVESAREMAAERLEHRKSSSAQP